MYCESTGYNEVKLRKINQRQMEKHGKEGIHKYVLQEGKLEKQNKKGPLQDVIRAYRSFYLVKGLRKYAAMNSKGDFNRYAIHPFQGKECNRPTDKEEEMDESKTDCIEYKESV